MSYLHTDSLVDLIEEGLLDGGALEQSITGITEGEATLKPRSIRVDSIGLEHVPDGLLSSFMFRSELGAAPKAAFDAGLLSISIVPIRLDGEGNTLPASPSIKNAAYAVTSRFKVGGELNSKCALSPDLYVEAAFYGEEGDETTIAIPTVFRKPYAPKEERAAVSVQLCSKNGTSEDWKTEHNTARATFTNLVQKVASELGVPAGEQFLICLVGYPQYSKAFNGKDSSFWGVSFDGAYMLGGRKISQSKSALPETLASLRVNKSASWANSELERARAKNAAKGKPVRKLVVANAATSVASPKSAPTDTPVAAPMTMPSGNAALAKLAAMNVVEEDDDFILMDETDFNLQPTSVVEPTTEYIEPTTEYVKDGQEEEEEFAETHVAAILVNPFA